MLDLFFIGSIHYLNPLRLSRIFLIVRTWLDLIPFTGANKFSSENILDVKVFFNDLAGYIFSKLNIPF